MMLVGGRVECMDAGTASMDTIVLVKDGGPRGIGGGELRLTCVLRTLYPFFKHLGRWIASMNVWKMPREFRLIGVAVRSLSVHPTVPTSTVLSTSDIPGP